MRVTHIHSVCLCVCIIRVGKIRILHTGGLGFKPPPNHTLRDTVHGDAWTGPLMQKESLEGFESVSREEQGKLLGKAD